MFDRVYSHLRTQGCGRCCLPVGEPCCSEATNPKVLDEVLFYILSPIEFSVMRVAVCASYYSLETNKSPGH